MIQRGYENTWRMVPIGASRWRLEKSVGFRTWEYHGDVRSEFEAREYIETMERGVIFLCSKDFIELERKIQEGALGCGIQTLRKRLGISRPVEESTSTTSGTQSY